MEALLQNWVTDQAMQQPDSPAVSRENRSLTYQELEILSNRLAAALIEIGCQPGDRVCFLMPKVPEAIVSIIGILKADCIYVPLDMASPANRLSKIVEKCTPRCILASGPVERKLINLVKRAEVHSKPSIGWMDPDGIPDNLAGEKQNIEFGYKDLNSFSADALNYKNSSDAPAHILYTSGSSGSPKGVVTTHGNNLEFIRWAKNYFDIRSDDHLSNHSPLHFDMSSLDIYGALSAGAQLHLLPSNYNAVPNKLANFIRNCGITQWFSVPSVLSFMAKFDVVEYEDFPSLKRLIWGGEVLPNSTLRYWMTRLPDVSFTNLYGPTETTVASSYYTVPEVPKSNEEIPIGKACAGESLYVLDDQLNPVPDGKVGNLYISGSGLSNGYWNEEEETEKSFLFNPYAINGDRTFYKTGDLAHFDENGYCYYHGRKDNQVKCNGYRIELGEIEKAIDSLQFTTECAVVTVPDDEGFADNKICCAFVPAGTQIEHIAGTFLELKLRNLLPQYMIPERWESYVILPKNRNGKVDRKVLEERFLRQKSEAKAE